MVNWGGGQKRGGQLRGWLKKGWSIVSAPDLLSGVRLALGERPNLLQEVPGVALGEWGVLPTGDDAPSPCGGTS